MFLEPARLSTPTPSPLLGTMSREPDAPQYGADRPREAAFFWDLRSMRPPPGADVKAIVRLLRSLGPDYLAGARRRAPFFAYLDQADSFGSPLVASLLEAEVRVEFIPSSSVVETFCRDAYLSPSGGPQGSVWCSPRGSRTTTSFGCCSSCGCATPLSGPFWSTKVTPAPS